MDLIGDYEVKPFTEERQNLALIIREGRVKPSIRALIELDVTKARKMIDKIKKEENMDISFTGWIAKCVADAVSDHKKLNSYRQGRKKIVVFEDVDIAIPIEREVDDRSTIRGYILRKANEKSVTEITNEIRKAQRAEVDKDTQFIKKDYTKNQKRLLKIPSFLKKLALKMLRKKGLKKKKHFGTVGITSIGTEGKCPGWFFPLGGINSTVIGVGGITEKPGVIDGEIEIREYLHLTVIVNHDLVDGGPLARFTDTLTELMEAAYGLNDL
ncbi:MAG: 2-oxo acid dehydrogenase subunit E2 [Candidatus Thermoplasmatota archaeon]